MSQPSSSAEDNATGVFEVFRVGSVPYDALLSQDFESVKQKYLLIVPINSKEDVKKDSCLAVIPPPSHMIVDQTKFRQLVAKQAVDLSAKRATEIAKRSEDMVENVKNACVAEVGRMYQSFQTIIDQQKKDMQEAISQAFSGTAKTPEESKVIIENVFKTYEQRIDAILAEMISSQNDLRDRDFGSLEDETEKADVPESN